MTRLYLNSEGESILNSRVIFQKERITFQIHINVAVNATNILIKNIRNAHVIVIYKKEKKICNQIQNMITKVKI